MTWLPVDVGEMPERDAVLGLKPGPYGVVRDTLTVLWRTTDPDLLELCRLRLAQLMGARAELAGVDGQLLDDLDEWDSHPRFSERERAALSYAEQYHYDHNGITGEQKAELARHLSPSEFVNFVWALHLNDSYIRILSLLDIEPDPPSTPARPERTRPPRASGRLSATRSRSDSHPDGHVYLDQGALMEPEFRALYLQLNPVIVREALVDPVSSEAIRLHNASHQRCRY